MIFTSIHFTLMRRLLNSMLLLVIALPVSAKSPEQAEATPPLATWKFEELTAGVCQGTGQLPLEGRYLDGLTATADPLAGRPSVIEFGPAASRARVEVSLGIESRDAFEKLIDGSFSWEAWIYDAAPGPDGRTNYSLFYYADQKRFVTNSTWLYRARQDGSYRFRMTDEAGNEAGVDIPPTDPTGIGDRQWHHYVIAVDRASPGGGQGSMRAYRDGELIAEQPLPNEMITIRHQGHIVLGNNHHANSPWQGAIDDVALFQTALNLRQVQQRYEDSKNPAITSTAERNAQREAFFEAKIRPLLIDKCTGCHTGDDFTESPLAFTSRKGLIRGAEFGPAIVPGKASESLLIQAVQWNHKALKMPPDEGDRLTRIEIEELRRWINDGAYWPPSDDVAEDETPHPTDVKEHVESDHWAFQPRTRPAPPEVPHPAWNQSDIDRFLYAKMLDKNIEPNDLADKRALIRRATFDLTGLNPTLEETEAFLQDPSEDAFTKVIDRLLASPRYGERWGRHWLDIARYADTQGDVGDFPIPTAYLYRDWVIDSLNADMPYDRFVQAQIAGDLMAHQAKNDQDARGMMVATGFVSLSRRFGNTKYEDKHLMIEDTIDTLGRSILGVTIRCARCHDHKFDPILQSDYFGLYGIFESTRYPTMGASNEKSPSFLSAAAPDPKLQEQLDDHYALIERYYYQINNHFRPWLKPTLQTYKTVSKQLKSTDLDKAKRRELEQRREACLAKYKGAFRELMLHGLGWIKKEKDRLASNPPTESIFGLTEDEPINSKLHLRGNPDNLGRVVPRRFPLILTDEETDSDSWQGSGRLHLARWLTTPDHPLTARVIVNRVWQHHFGRGLVATSSNFGVKGDQPSHPQLLDYLADVFVEEDGWSLKALHRRIMLSRAYRLSSRTTDLSLQNDADNIYLARFARRRLEAEAIRDSMLQISGNLDLNRPGPFPFPHWKGRSYSLNNPFRAEYDHNHRSIYLMTQRLFRQSFFALFDGPDRNQSTEKRTTSALPTQVLFLLNSPFVEKQSHAFADRILKNTKNDQEAIQFAYQRVYGRLPTMEEQQITTRQIDSLSAAILSSGEMKPEEVRPAVWKAVAKSLFASNEFLHVE
ncbi:DUF1553 domain-containing protein [Bremerella alba]|uniref:Cytochrome c domain-containing protein n=1 Tax=Bremerella alba TaxID=980252 RepID=A0A7V8V2L3_9BACT|nr:DUF1553 domain-containing protein [Bremerella alba]MBA2113789.1 hypothetical protein [Bremerella alba]